MPDLGPSGKDGAGYSSIVVSNGAGVKQYVQLLGRGLVGIRAADGKHLWRYNRVANDVANISTPIVRGDWVFASTGYQTGSVLLELSRSGEGVAAREVYFLDATTLQNHHGGLVLVGDHVYAGHGHNNGFPICVEFATGKVAWGGDIRNAGTGSAAVMYADGRLYFRYENGVVVLIEASPAGVRGEGLVHDPRGQPTRAGPHLAIADGRLYVREQDSLFCYDVRQAKAASDGEELNRMATPHPRPRARLTRTEWLICFVAALGFAFDIYELLMLPLIVRPGAAGARRRAGPAARSSTTGSGWLFWVPARRRRHLRPARRLPDRPLRPPARARVEHPALRVLGAAPPASRPRPAAALLPLHHLRRRVRRVRRRRRLAGRAVPRAEAARAVLGYTQAFSSLGGLMVTGAYYLAVHYADVAARDPRRPRGLALHADLRRHPGAAADPDPAVPAGVAGLAARRRRRAR